MASFFQSIVVPGNVLTAVMVGDLSSGRQWETTFQNNYRMSVRILEEGDAQQIYVELFDQSGEVRNAVALGGELDRTYQLDDNGNSYRMQIARGARASRDQAAIDSYVAGRSQDLTNRELACIACDAPDLMLYRIIPTRPPTDLRRRVECCECGASWVEVFAFQGLSADPDDFCPPNQEGR